MKFRGHETFAIRKGWLNKGIRNILVNPNVFVSKTENPMDVLGIGSNMVKSLRYWLQATNLTKEPNAGKRSQSLTEMGERIYNNDPYFEEIGSLWLVHYALAKNKKEATAWYVFFNEFDQDEFSEDDFCNTVIKYVTMISPENIPSIRAVGDDFKCIINTYVSKNQIELDKVNPEDNMICPLTELGLITPVSNNQGKRIYKKAISKVEEIPALIALAVIIDTNNGKNEIKISELQNGKNSLGKMFVLDTISLLSILYRLETLGYLKVVRTAGLDIVKLTTNMTFIDCINKYYVELNEK